MCYLTGHGIGADRIAELIALCRRFFALPRDQLHAVDKLHSPHFRGYTGVGSELTGGRRDWREMFDYGREQPARLLRPGDPPWTALTDPNQWPPALPGLAAVLLSWQEEVVTVGRTLLRALAVALRQPAEAFDDLYGEQAHPTTKLALYHSRPDPDYDQGIGVHKDHGILTVLLQDSVGGLQAADRDGHWRDVTPVPGSLVVNVGELLEFATGGYLLAPAHRVVAPAGGTTRVSAAFFINPRLDAEITPIPLPPRLAGHARPTTIDPADPLYATYGRNAFRMWARSHPEVIDKHYT